MNPFFPSRTRWTGALMALGLSALLSGCGGGSGGPSSETTRSANNLAAANDAPATEAPATEAENFVSVRTLPTPSPTQDKGFITFRRGPNSYQNPSQLWTMRPDGSKQQRIRTGIEFVYDPNVGRNGRKIVFGGGDIGVINSGGGSERHYRVGQDESVIQPAISPNGRLIVYSTGTIFGQIVLINSDGTHPRVLRTTDDVDGFQDNPQFSPDGRRIFYRTERSTEGIVIHSMNLDGSGDKRALFGDDTAFIGEFSLHPDGKRVVYRRNGDIEFGGTGELVVTNLDGTNRKVIYPSAYTPVWSLDGRKIAFARPAVDDRFNNDIFVINADGTGLKNITNTPDVDESSPSWGGSLS